MKIAIYGERKVGITSIMKTFGAMLSNPYEEFSVGAKFWIKEIFVENRTIKLQLWDVTHEAQFRAVHSVYALGSLGGLFVYDITQPQTFEKLKPQVQEFWKNNGKGIIPVVIVGNKIDLRDQTPNSVKREKSIQFCQELSEQTISKGFHVPFIETSAKTGENIREPFVFLARIYLKMVAEQELLAKNKK
ncbi:MAG: Rab family GTPase [Candidatus Hodarchaeota archaeon]